jgi:aryl-alcohol dehydrogenase-like predicted oxidoreductase
MAMAGFPARIALGRTGLSVGPLGVAGGYGASAGAVWRAVERGCTYLYHGSRRSEGMRRAIRELVAAGRRDELAIVLQSYSRWPRFMERSVARGLAELGVDHADVLLLGWYNRVPAERLLERAALMMERGLVRHLAISGHRRSAFVDFAGDERLTILHIRYNAAHTGAERDIFPRLPREGRPGIVAYTATRWGSLLKERNMPPGERPLRGRDAYRFVLSNPDFDVCLCGPANDAEMEEALAALDEGPLDPDEASRIRAVGRFVHARAWRK